MNISDWFKKTGSVNTLHNLNISGEQVTNRTRRTRPYTVDSTLEKTATNALRGGVYRAISYVWPRVFEVHELPALLESTHIEVYSMFPQSGITNRPCVEKYRVKVTLELPDQKHPAYIGFDVNVVDMASKPDYLNSIPSDFPQELERMMVKAKMLRHIK